MELNAAVQELIASTNGVLEVTTIVNKEGNNVVRVKCTATNHEMPPREDVIKAHFESKRYKKATEWYSHDFSQYEPYIVSHRRKPKCLYCNVTGIVLNKIPSQIEKHMNGKRFIRLKEQVKFFDEKELEKEDKDFDANKFEFFNRQLLNDEDDDEEGHDDDEVAPSKKQKSKEDEEIDSIFYKDHSDEEDEEDNDEDKEVDEEDDEAVSEEETQPAKFVKKSVSKRQQRKPVKSAPKKQKTQ